MQRTIQVPLKPGLHAHGPRQSSGGRNCTEKSSEFLFINFPDGCARRGGCSALHNIVTLPKLERLSPAQPLLKGRTHLVAELVHLPRSDCKPTLLPSGAAISRAGSGAYGKAGLAYLQRLYLDSTQPSCAGKPMGRGLLSLSPSAVWISPRPFCQRHKSRYREPQQGKHSSYTSWLGG